MILVDSSVWIDHLRGNPTPGVLRLRDLDPFADILIGDLILMEVLQGAKNEEQALRIERELRAFPVATMLGHAHAVLAASHYRTLRRLGITIRKSIDVVIATFCIAEGHALLHEDRDFGPFARHLGLQTI